MHQPDQSTLGFLRGRRIARGAAIAALAAISFSSSPTGSRAADVEPSFTGERLTILYVRDVRRSVAFYEALGFRLAHYYDYDADAYSRNWTQPEPDEIEKRPWMDFFYPVRSGRPSDRLRHETPGLLR